ncbi:hypothetical protein MIB92_16680 [Aestuariirhabdus sp. Z084]|uniref:alkaline phosphatase family protein n=1 Tax=Aestuariirhabdus haliotis TaxID=2918751 RepID=UPI00201B3C68|nr:alkaline phosphatase family protein [Aestuariirhabdus haliotis]MCL6417297.1 hypothetical protein [Aestuariirhabdus haliotis]MCL6421242.1 hypothetical protein [Aestuariirhabdus haliotis]
MNTPMPQIKHVILLMLENRSLDNVLGWLYEAENNTPLHVIPEGSAKQYDGLVVGNFSNPYQYQGKTRSYAIHKGLTGNPTNVPDYDPYEEYEHVNNQLFGSAKAWDKKVTPTKSNTPKPANMMQGFFQDYSASWMTWEQTLQILQTYTPKDLPVLHTLARQYAVSDRWFSSVPSQTNPNRAFAHCGSSMGRVVNEHKSSVEQFKWWDRSQRKYVWARNIWNVLDEHKVSWRIYYSSPWPPKALSPLKKQHKGFTHYTFLGDYENLHRFKKMQFFAEAVKANTLDEFVFIEPKWGGGFGGKYGTVQGNDYHPPANVRPGEVLLKNIVDTLKSNSEVWNESLLVITFDEHGGTYDHVPPPWGAPRPDKSEGDGFLFDRYGVRVPTILVSPWIEEGTVFRAPPKQHFDHTSLIATVLKWRGIDPAKSGLGKRVSRAPTFDNVVNRTSPRTDFAELKVATAAKLRPIKVANKTNTKVKIYLGWGNGSRKASVLTVTGKYQRAESAQYNANTDTASHDYWVSVGYWAGPSSDHEPVDRFTGLQWRLLWQGWRHILHHQSMTVKQAAITTKFGGNDVYDRHSKITISNNTHSRVYYHLYSKAEKGGAAGKTLKGYINRGESMVYHSGKDTFRWRYRVIFSTWVGDEVIRGKEKVDGTIDRSWRFFWGAPKVIKRNGSLVINQPKPTVSFQPEGWDIRN